ncbi:unnamed protein product, partial [Laminaria digitata]
NNSSHSIPELTSPFAYPPNIYPYTLLASIGSTKLSLILLAIINMTAALALAAGTLIVFHKPPLQPTTNARTVLISLLMLSAVIASPFASHNIWMSQTSLLAISLFVIGWLVSTLGFQWLGCAMFSLGLFKPNLAIAIAPIMLIRWPKHFLITSTMAWLA